MVRRPCLYTDVRPSGDRHALGDDPFFWNDSVQAAWIDGVVTKTWVERGRISTVTPHL